MVGTLAPFFYYLSTPRHLVFHHVFQRHSHVTVTTRAILFSNHVFLLEQATEYCLPRSHPSLADKISDSPEI